MISSSVYNTLISIITCQLFWVSGFYYCGVAQRSGYIFQINFSAVAVYKDLMDSDKSHTVAIFSDFRSHKMLLRVTLNRIHQNKINEKRLKIWASREEGGTRMRWRRERGKNWWFLDDVKRKWPFIDFCQQNIITENENDNQSNGNSNIRYALSNQRWKRRIIVYFASGYQDARLRLIFKKFPAHGFG
jgi:hypothetical protein